MEKNIENNTKPLFGLQKTPQTVGRYAQLG
jgi:hypothetical protein